MTQQSMQNNNVALGNGFYDRILPIYIVSLQFKKINKKWNDEISQWGLFYVNQYFIKFLLTLKFIVSDKIS